MGTPRSDVFLRRSFMGVNLRGNVPVRRVRHRAGVASMPRSAATFDFYPGADASLSSSDRVERFEDGREPGLLPGVPGLDVSEPGVPGLPGEPSSSASLSTCVASNQ